jgi:hypothetical protein
MGILNTCIGKRQLMDSAALGMLGLLPNELLFSQLLSNVGVVLFKLDSQE